MSKRKTIEEWQSESDVKYNSEFTILEEPTSGQHNVNVLHKKCGNITSMRLNNHLKRYCIYCSNKFKKTKEDWQKLSDKIHNSEFEILDDPKNGKTKIDVCHKVCGNTFSVTMNNHINHENKCPICSNHFIKGHEYWIGKCKEIYNDDYEILEEVTHSHKLVNIRHNICGKTHKKSMSAFIHSLRGCPICALQDKKFGENYIEDYLTENGIYFEKQKTFTTLVNPNTDFWIPGLRTGIEVNGAQHYKPIPCWGGEKEFESQIYRDNLKEEFFKQNNFVFIIINNKQLTKIKDYL